MCGIRVVAGICAAGFTLSACGGVQPPLGLQNASQQAITRAKPTEHVLYSFQGTPDGEYPRSGVIAGAPGTFYGTTEEGGSNRFGTVFQLSRIGKHGKNYVETILRNAGYADLGQGSPLVRDHAGNLYGTTLAGGYLGPCDTGIGCGTVFELSPSRSGYKETLLWRFNETDGAYPTGGVVRDKNGALYGQTEFGGAHGDGTVFKLTPSSSGYSETILHSFSGGQDGLDPQGTLVADTAGALYSGTEFGGSQNDGVVYKLTPSGSSYTESILHSFRNKKDGELPVYGETVDAAGAVFGAANGGCCGEVFELLPSGRGYRERTIYDFKGGSDGGGPTSPLLDVAGVLYGETGSGGYGPGTVFELSPAGKTYRERVLYRFLGGGDGNFPAGGLAIAGQTLYGTTQEGGQFGYGTVFELAHP